MLRCTRYRTAFLCVSLSLLHSCGEPQEQETTNPILGDVATPNPEPSSSAKAWSNPDCEPANEGKFSGTGNQWARYSSVCSQDVSINFDAFPPGNEPRGRFGYWIQSGKCTKGFPTDDPGRFTDKFHGDGLPDGFYDEPFEVQLRLLNSSLRRDLNAFAEHCEIQIETERFLGQNLNEEYKSMGDSWWFRCDDNGCLTMLARIP